MNHGLKILILVATHLLCASAGALLGIWYVWRPIQKANAMMDSMMVTTRYLTHVELQRAEGNDERYREALLAFVSVLDRVPDPNDPLYSEKGNLTDKMLTYIRLARLEQRAGNSAKSEAYMKQAVSICEGFSWKDCQRDYLISISEHLEKKSIFGELSGKNEQETSPKPEEKKRR